MKFPVPSPRNFDYSEEHESIGLCADVPIGTDQPLDYYKHIAVRVLAQQIANVIEPEFIEAEGFEVLRYPIIVIRNGEDGRNHVRVVKK
jgi:hypothetical protein